MKWETLDGPDGGAWGWITNGHGGVLVWAAIITDELVGPFRIEDGLKINVSTEYYCHSVKFRLHNCFLLPLPLDQQSAWQHGDWQLTSRFISASRDTNMAPSLFSLYQFLQNLHKLIHFVLICVASFELQTVRVSYLSEQLIWNVLQRV